MVGRYHDGGAVIFRLQRTLRKRGKEASRPNLSKDDEFLLRQIVQHLYPYVKIIQGIFVSKGVQDKHVDLFDLARELLDMKPGLDLESFKKDGLEGLSTELKDMVTKVADVCAAEGRNCGDISETKAILINVENVSKKLNENYSKMFKDGGTLPFLVEIKNSYVQAMIMRDSVEDLGKHLKSVANDTIPEAERTIVFSAMVTADKKYDSSKKMFENKFSQEALASLSKKNLAQKFEAMKKLEIVNTELDKIKYDVLITKFNHFKELVSIFESKISDQKQWPLIEKRLRIMTALSNKSGLEINQKSLTRAFLNGFKDLTELLREIDSAFVEKVILKGGDPEQLKKALVPIGSLQSELKPIYEVLEKRKSTDAAERKIKTWVEEASLEVQELKKVESFNECIPALQNFNLTLDAKSWISENANIETLDDEAEKFAINLSGISFELPTYEKLAALFYENKLIPDMLESIKNYSELDKATAELQALYDSLNKLATNKLEQWVKKTEIHNLVQEAKDWLEKTEAGQTLQCLQNKELFESIRNIMSKQILLPAIQRMKPSDDAIEDVENAEKLLKEAFEKYGKLISMHHNRKSRAVDKQKRVDESIQITTDLAFALKFYMDVSSAYLLEKEIQKLLTFSDAIEAAIERLTDQDKKIRMKKMWNGKTKLALKSLPKVVEDFTKSIVSLPEKLEDYTKVFNVTSFDSLDGDINMKVFLDELRSMNSLLIDQPTAEKLETLDLEFSNAKQKRLSGYQAFLLSMPILSSFQPPQKTIGNDENKITPLGYTCAIIGVVVGLLLGEALFVMWLSNFRETKKKIRGAWKAFKMIFPCWEKKPLEIKVKKFVPIQRHEKEEDEKVEFYSTAEGKIIVKAKTDHYIEKNPTAIKLTKTENGVPKVEKIKKEELNDGLIRISAADLKKNLSKKQLKALNDLESTAVEYAQRENAANAVFQQQKPAGEDLTIFFKRRSIKQLKILSELKFEELPRCEDKPVISNDVVEYAVGIEKDKYETVENLEKLRSSDNISSDKQLKTRNLSKRNGKESLKPVIVPEASTKTMKDLTRAVSTSSVEVQKTQESERAAAGEDELPKVEVGTHGLKIIPHLKYRCEIAFETLLEIEEEREDKIEYSNFLEKDYTNDYFEKNELPRTDGKLNYLYIQKFMTSRAIVQNLGYVTGDSAAALQPVFCYELALEILKNAKEIFEKEPALLKLTREKLRVIGDIHGTYADMARHVELGLEDTVSSFLFLGDYVDRGPRSIDTLLYLCILKMTNPSRFKFLRGNHELRSVNSSYGFLEECMMVYGKTNGFEFWKAANMFFDELPVACIIGDRVWAAHGGISPLMLEGRAFIEENLVKKPANDIQYKLFLDVLWSDPERKVPGGAEIERMFTVNSRFKVTSCFTFHGLDKVLETCGFAFVIRGHQLKLLGHETFHGDKCITTYGGSNHMDEKNLACQTIIHKNLKVEFIRFKNYGDECIKDCEDTVIDDENENTSSSDGSSLSNVKTTVSEKSKSSAGSSKSGPSSKKSTSTTSTSNPKPSDIVKKAVAKADPKRPSCAPPDVMTSAKPSKSQASAQPKAKPKETVKAKK